MFPSMEIFLHLFSSLQFDPGMKHLFGGVAILGGIVSQIVYFNVDFVFSNFTGKTITTLLFFPLRSARNSNIAPKCRHFPEGIYSRVWEFFTLM